MILANATGETDTPAYSYLHSVESPIPKVLVSRANNFVFNEALLELSGKPYVLFCFCEYGANDWDRKETHIWGENFDQFKYAFPQEEWVKFDEFVKNNPPVLTFKRELLKKDVRTNLIPIEYPCFLPPFSTESKHSFENRLIDVFQYWGHSHESRRVLHGNIWVNASKKGYAVCDNYGYVLDFLKEEKNPRKWVTLNMPHYFRVDIRDILAINGASKISVSLPGAGVKCFRHAEAPVNSVMLLQQDYLAWTYEWKHGINCIRVPIGETIEDIKGANGCPEIDVIEYSLKRPDLHDIYLNGIETIDKYRPINYTPHLEKKIKEYV